MSNPIVDREGCMVDAPRSGCPPVYTAADRAQVTAWACSLPVDHDVPLSPWSTTELARQLLTEGSRCRVSTVRRRVSTVRRRSQAVATSVVDLHA